MNPQRYQRSLAQGAINYELSICDADSDRWLVLVHGINRDVDALMRWFADVARVCDYNLIAPIFDHARYDDYQRLGRAGLGMRADLALLAIIEDTRSMGLRLPARLPLFGFSGGAQFAHRFALAHGERLSALVCAAAGWYTPLCSAHTYPYGLKPTKRLRDIDFRADRLLSLPTLTMVGDEDVVLDDAVRRHPKIDRLQGHTRVDRALWWHEHLTRKAPRRATHLFELMQGCDHDFRNCALRGELAERVIAFCNLVLDDLPGILESTP